MTLLVNHTATIVNIFSVDQDGKTPMQKARGTTANKEMERVQGEKTVPANEEVQPRNNFDVRWQYGLFMGVVNENE